MTNRSLRIVIADDHQDTIDFLGLWLVAQGHSVYGCNQLDRLDDLLSDTIDVLLLDLLFPAGEASSEIPRIRTKFPTLKIIVMSGTPDLNITLRSIEAGADSYLTKPVELDVLSVLLENLKVA